MRFFGEGGKKGKIQLPTKMVKSKGILKVAKSAQVEGAFFSSFFNKFPGISGSGQRAGGDKHSSALLGVEESDTFERGASIWGTILGRRKDLVS